MSTQQSKLSRNLLLALVVGSMIGSGIFSLPQNMAVGSSAGAVLIAWLITGAGMLCLALIFQNLAIRKPELNSGVYAYAKVGLGEYTGFCSAWGYWLSAVIGNVGYLVLIFATLGHYFPIFGEGNTPAAIITASVWLWLMHFLTLKGIKQAAIINHIGTITKVVPIILFIAIALVSFQSDLFFADFWGSANTQLGSVVEQVRGAMLVTVWAFIGIEGASVYSERAQHRRDVGYATVLGFVLTLLLLILVNMLSFGILKQAELAGLKNPSMAYVLEHIVGSWGGLLISLGLLVSVAGALLAWTLLAAEVLYVAAKDKVMPSVLSQENSHASPNKALWLTNGLAQLILLATLWNNSTYLSLIYLATSMILLPYFFSAFYALMLSVKGETYDNHIQRYKDMFIAGLGVLYAIWLIYGGGLKYVLLSALLYAVGLPFFIKARRETNSASIFSTKEKYLVAVVITSAITALISLKLGWISL